MTTQGKVLEVGPYHTGDNLDGDHASGTRLLQLHDVSDFGDFVLNDGTESYPILLAFNEATYSVVAKDTELNQLTLDPASPGLSVGFVDDGNQDSRVFLTPLSQERWATVEVDDDQAPVMALIPHDLENRFADGIRDPFDQETVIIDLVDEGWQVVDLVGVFPSVYWNSGEVPNPVTPTEPPAPPILKLTGMSRGFVLQWLNPEPGSKITVSVSNTVQGLNHGMLSATAQSTLYFANAPDGTSFLPGPDEYEFVVDAINVVGGVTNLISGQLRLEDSSSIAELSVDNLVSGNLVAAVAVIGGLTIGNIALNPDVGLFIPQPGGGIIHLPSDGATPARITSHIVTNSLTVEDNGNFGGTNQLLPSAKLSLGNGVSAPTTKASASRHWDSVQMQVTGGAENHRGLTNNEAGDWATVFAFDGLWFMLANPVNGGVLAVKVDPSGSNLPGYAPYGVTRIGGSYYTLGQDVNRSGRWFVYRINATTYTKTAEYEFTFTGGNNKKTPTIGNDGTNVVLAWWADQPTSGTDTIYVRRFDITSSPMTQVGSTILCELSGLGLHVATSVHYGTADFAGAASRIVVSRAGVIYAFTTAGARQSASEWIRAGSGSIVGMVWNGTNFYSLDGSAKVWKYESNLTSVSEGHKMTWYDNDALGGNHETTAGPEYTFTRVARSKILVEVQPAPQAGVVGNNNAATHTRLYSGVAGGAWRLQNTVDSNNRSFVLGALNTGSAEPPLTNGFDAIAASPASILSSATDGVGSLIKLSGDGSWRLGVWATDSTGLPVAGGVPYSFRYRSVDQSLPTGTETDISFDTSVETNLLTWSSANRDWTVTRAGIYTMTGLVNISANGTGRRYAKLLISNSQNQLIDGVPISGQRTSIPIAMTKRLAVGTTIKVAAFQSSGSTLEISGSGVALTNFSIALVGY